MICYYCEKPFDSAPVMPPPSGQDAVPVCPNCISVAVSTLKDRRESMMKFRAAQELQHRKDTAVVPVTGIQMRELLPLIGSAINHMSLSGHHRDSGGMSAYVTCGGCDATGDNWPRGDGSARVLEHRQDCKYESARTLRTALLTAWDKVVFAGAEEKS